MAARGVGGYVPPALRSGAPAGEDLPARRERIWKVEVRSTAAGGLSVQDCPETFLQETNQRGPTLSRYFELPSDAATRELRDVVEWFAKAALTPCPAGRDGDPNAALVLPPSLSKEDRKLFHNMADQVGLLSFSSGVERGRYLTIKSVVSARGGGGGAAHQTHQQHSHAQPGPHPAAAPAPGQQYAPQNQQQPQQQYGVGAGMPGVHGHRLAGQPGHFNNGAPGPAGQQYMYHQYQQQYGQPGMQAVGAEDVMPGVADHRLGGPQHLQQGGRGRGRGGGRNAERLPQHPEQGGPNASEYYASPVPGHAPGNAVPQYGQPQHYTAPQQYSAPAPAQPQHVPDHRYKTTLCRNWLASGQCARGERCLFAHGEHELRSNQPGGAPAGQQQAVTQQHQQHSSPTRVPTYAPQHHQAGPPQALDARIAAVGGHAQPGSGRQYDSPQHQHMTPQAGFDDGVMGGRGRGRGRGAGGRGQPGNVSPAPMGEVGDQQQGRHQSPYLQQEGGQHNYDPQMASSPAHMVAAGRGVAQGRGRGPRGRGATQAGGTLPRPDARVMSRAREVWAVCQAEGGKFAEYSQGELYEMLIMGQQEAGREEQQGSRGARGASNGARRGGRHADAAQQQQPQQAAQGADATAGSAEQGEASARATSPATSPDTLPAQLAAKYPGLPHPILALIVKRHMGLALVEAVQQGDEEKALTILSQEPMAAWVRAPPATSGAVVPTTPTSSAAEGLTAGPASAEGQGASEQQQGGRAAGGRHAGRGGGPAGASLSHYGPYPIHIAVEKGMQRLLAALAALPGVVEQRNADFQTPLKLARKLQTGHGTGQPTTAGNEDAGEGRGSSKAQLDQIVSVLLAAGAKDPANAQQRATAGGGGAGVVGAVRVALGPPPPVAPPRPAPAQGKHKGKASAAAAAAGSEATAAAAAAEGGDEGTAAATGGEGVAGGEAADDADAAAAAAAEAEAAARAARGFTFARGRSWGPGGAHGTVRAPGAPAQAAASNGSTPAGPVAPGTPA